jgi:hypothetical protein
MIEFSIRGIGAWGPGFGNWPELLDGVRNGRWVEEAPLKPERIPPRERRRSPRFVKMAVEVMSQACAAADIDPADLAVVFSTAMSDMRTNDYMCRALVDTPDAVSPTKFHNSVNNAATGYWSIATGSHAASNALCAFRYSAGMGLLEAVTQAEAEQRPVLLVVQDETAPPPLEHICASTVDLALAVLVDAAGSPTGGLARWRLETAVGAAPQPELPAALQSRVAGNPGADLLPFLLAHGRAEPGAARVALALNSNLHARLELAGREGATA